MEKNIPDLIWKILTYITPILSGLMGVFVGAWLSGRQSQEQRKLDFCEKQLRELYSPLVSIRKEIQILSEFRLAGAEASKTWWQKVCKRGKYIKDMDKSVKFFDEEGEKITTQIEYENKQLVEKIIPAYRQMVNILKNNYWLAEEPTKDHFPTLIKFVEVWERYLSRTHPIDVIKEINVSENELMPFYKNTEQIHCSLRKKLKNNL